MRFKAGAPNFKFDNDIYKLYQDAGWKQVKEPKNIQLSILISIPFMIINVFISSLVAGKINPNATVSFVISSLPQALIFLFSFLLTIVTMMILHEVLHLVFVPDFYKSEKTFIGISWFGAYVYSEEEISKWRFCIIFLTPYVIISIILQAILGILGLYSFYSLIFVFFNSIGSSVDILSFFIVLFTVPNGSILTMKGTGTYYKQFQN